MNQEGRPLPKNLDAERAVLGAVLLDKCTLSVASRQLNCSDFSLTLHQRIFHRMLAMSDGGQPIDLVLLTEAMQAAGELHGGEEIAYVAGLTDGLPRVSNVEHYAHIVKEKSLLRQIAHAGESLVRAALAGELDEARSILSTTAEAATARPQNSGTSRKLASAEEFLKRSASENGNWLAEGLFHTHSYTIWQGRPKVGKSHTLLQLCFDLACGLPAFGRFQVTQPVRCVYVELEEPEPVTKSRFAAILRAHSSRGPENENLHFLSREDVCRWRMLPRELVGARVRDFAAILKDAGAQLVVLVALRKFLAAGENLKDPDIAERLNEGIEILRMEVGCAIAVAHHDRKSPAETIEAQGFGSTFLSAATDAIFDIERAVDGTSRKVRVEARYSALDCFFLAREVVGSGEVIRCVDAPRDENAIKLESLRNEIQQGKSLRKAAKVVGVPLATASRWLGN